LPISVLLKGSTCASPSEVDTRRSHKAGLLRAATYLVPCDRAQRPLTEHLLLRAPLTLVRRLVRRLRRRHLEPGALRSPQGEARCRRLDTLHSWRTYLAINSARLSFGLLRTAAARPSRGASFNPLRGLVGPLASNAQSRNRTASLPTEPLPTSRSRTGTPRSARRRNSVTRPAAPPRRSCGTDTSCRTA
jgi:hypothetical protein